MHQKQFMKRRIEKMAKVKKGEKSSKEEFWGDEEKEKEFWGDDEDGYDGYEDDD